MDQGPLTAPIMDEFATLPPRLKAAARFIIDHPDDVALLSMREQARLAGVQPATMTRLAQRLGFGGYDAVRRLYAEAVRAGDLGFSGGAGRQLAEQKEKGDFVLAADFAAALGDSLDRWRQPGSLESLTRAAAGLAAARRIYCLGLRASFPMAWTVNYILGLLGDRAVLLDAGSGVMADRTRQAGGDDVVLVFGFAPYTQLTVETACGLYAAGVPVVAVTDSLVSPLARIAQQSVLIANANMPVFFRAMTPAFAAAEILAALVVGKAGDAALEALDRTESHLLRNKVHWVDPKPGEHV
ncbi:MAG: MurR/RpiR family transcriptional regulator [Rhodospirillaceae bacterium]|nr:MurR/RpiR family transcriptional regulator [Rhodospirillaceae bacterium]